MILTKKNTPKKIQKNETYLSSPWLFNDKIFAPEDFEGMAGFVYLITDKETGMKYVGRKYFTSTRKQKSGGRRKTSMSDWMDYFGSSDELKKLVLEHGRARFRREILSIHSTKGDTNIFEVKTQFLMDVLEDETFMNGNINGKWHKQPKHIINKRVFSDKMKSLFRR